MRDFRSLAERIAFEEDIEVDGPAEQELLSISLNRPGFAGGPNS